MKRSFGMRLGISFAVLAHFAVIPVFALYGVKVCMVLKGLGLLFGCKYNLAFVFFVLALNSALTVSIWRGLVSVWKSNPTQIKLFKYFPALSMISHIASFWMGAYLMNIYLRNMGVPSGTIHRLNIAVAITTALLATFQANVMDWISQTWLQSTKVRASRSALRELKKVRQLGLSTRWFAHSVWNALPIVAAVGIAITFLYQGLIELVEVEEVTLPVIHELISSTATIVGLLALWAVLIRVVVLFKERSLLGSFQDHIQALTQMDPTYYSSEVAPGFWGDIFGALNHSTEILTQRARLVKGFSTYVASSMVEKVLTQKELKTEGELKDLTILVSDLRDFTSISNSLTPEKVVLLLNTYFADMIEVLSQYDVVLDKFIGDGILAYLDSKDKSKEELNRLGVQAAVNMRKKLIDTNQKLTALGLPTLKLGVAVHCGPVILGSIGASQKMQYTIIGDAVNATSRLEGLCKKFASEVIISEEVYQSLHVIDRAQFKDCGSQEIRGLEKPMRIYSMLDENQKSEKIAG
ncbi:MAG: adenylate/guanylate cyclase domain-containing protein [Bdellovibrionota bacterium]